jgi:hypothetical protein
VWVKTTQDNRTPRTKTISFRIASNERRSAHYVARVSRPTTHFPRPWGWLSPRGLPRGRLVAPYQLPPVEFAAGFSGEEKPGALDEEPLRVSRVRDMGSLATRPASGRDPGSGELRSGLA